MGFYGEPIQLVLGVEKVLPAPVAGLVYHCLQGSIDSLKDSNDLLDIGSELDELPLNITDGKVVGKVLRIVAGK